jgi:hypothetical protein
MPRPIIVLLALLLSTLWFSLSTWIGFALYYSVPSLLRVVLCYFIVPFALAIAFGRVLTAAKPKNADKAQENIADTALFLFPAFFFWLLMAVAYYFNAQEYLYVKHYGQDSTAQISQVDAWRKLGYIAFNDAVAHKNQAGQSTRNYRGRRGSTGLTETHRVLPLRSSSSSSSGEVQVWLCDVASGDQYVGVPDPAWAGQTLQAPAGLLLRNKHDRKNALLAIEDACTRHQLRSSDEPIIMMYRPDGYSSYMQQAWYRFKILLYIAVPLLVLLPWLLWLRAGRHPNKAVPTASKAKSRA